MLPLDLGLQSKGKETLSLERNEKNAIYINESGLYSLILRSKLESAQVFKRWGTKEALPSMRKTGRYSYDDMNHKYNNTLTFQIVNELDLHIKVVSFLKKRYPNSIFTATFGENQGYLCGFPDLIINNVPKYYTGFAIEFKNQKELAFCHMISLRCCDSMKKMVSKLSLIMTMTI